MSQPSEDSGNLFANIPLELPEELSQTLLEAGHVRVERIVSRGHASPAGFWYDQPQHEWVMLLSGSATLRFDDEPQPRYLKPGDYVQIAARRRHRVESTSTDEPSVWLAIHFD